MDEADEREDVEDAEMLYVVELRAENLKSEELAKEDVLKLMVGHEGKNVCKPIPAFVEPRLIHPCQKIFLMA
jgi:hypothetical protein